MAMAWVQLLRSGVCQHLRELRTSDASFAQVNAELEHAPNLETLRLFADADDEEPLLLALPRLSHLTSLHVDFSSWYGHSGDPTCSPEHIGACAGLRSLTIDEASRSDAAAAALGVQESRPLHTGR